MRLSDLREVAGRTQLAESGGPDCLDWGFKLTSGRAKTGTSFISRWDMRFSPRFFFAMLVAALLGRAIRPRGNHHRAGRGLVGKTPVLLSDVERSRGRF